MQQAIIIDPECPVGISNHVRLILAPPRLDSLNASVFASNQHDPYGMLTTTHDSIPGSMSPA